MAAIKLHLYRVNYGDDGQDNCDYRGNGEHGAGENDQHRTVYEIDPASEEEINEVLKHGPAVNMGLDALRELIPDFAEKIASLLGLEGDGPIGLRVGVWNK